jgi:excinuclease ABC subunit A
LLDKITVQGARQHNLKNISVEIPRNRLTVITGLSGSGKSSLAFDTIYAEGQRRYVESLSAYARQFLDQLEKPDVDSIEGLSPAISIEQKTTSRSPRSTVGTITEIYDYLRLLFSSIGQPACYQCGQPISRQSVEQIINHLGELPEGERVMILAPMVRGRKGEFRKELERLAKEGFVRARIDGEIRPLDEEIVLDKRRNHSIEAVVDRLLIKPGIQKRLNDAIRLATRVSGGTVVVAVVDGEERLYSEKMTCVECGISLPVFEPRSFSFNSRYGACPSCQGIGTCGEVDPQRLISDATKSIQEIDFLATDLAANSRLKQALVAIAGLHKIALTKSFQQLSEKAADEFWYGTKVKLNFEHGGHKFQADWEGASECLKRLYEGTKSEEAREELASYVVTRPCTTCKGRRLRPESLAVRVAGRSIAEYVEMPIGEAVEIFTQLTLTPREEKVAGLLLREIRNRLGFLANVGLGYLALERSAVTLSGGEGQRIRLATQIGAQLRGVLYVLDEPSIGLHPRDNQKLLETLLRLRDIGNTVVVVEHDEETIRQADYLIDLGPGAGAEGGHIVASGTPNEVARVTNSLTGNYLSGARRITTPPIRRQPNGKFLRILGATENNLKKLDVNFPLGLFIVVTGVSGSGKSTLIENILYRSLAQQLYQSLASPGEHQEITGIEHLDKVIEIDQAPIGRTPRSNPATYTGLFTPLRELYASLPDSRERGYRVGRFSFNVKGGRCETCQGDGMKRIEMSFLPDVYVLCDACQGTRYNRETLAVRYKGLSIAEMLEKSVSEAIPLLDAIPPIKQKLQTLHDVGLGYIRLGQAATTLSGGEAQRIKLAKELSRRATGRTLYILDEPTTGLHFEDVRRLLDMLQQLVEMGNTVVVIEHNLDVIKSADWVIDLGPEGGAQGGRIVAEGPPEGIARVRRSYTGQALKRLPEFAHLNYYPTGSYKKLISKESQ